jgi:hypothetical protein
VGPLPLLLAVLLRLLLAAGCLGTDDAATGVKPPAGRRAAWPSAGLLPLLGMGAAGGVSRQRAACSTASPAAGWNTGSARGPCGCAAPCAVADDGGGRSRVLQGGGAAASAVSSCARSQALASCGDGAVCSSVGGAACVRWGSTTDANGLLTMPTQSTPAQQLTGCLALAGGRDGWCLQGACLLKTPGGLTHRLHAPPQHPPQLGQGEGQGAASAISGSWACFRAPPPAAGHVDPRLVGCRRGQQLPQLCCQRAGW